MVIMYSNVSSALRTSFAVPQARDATTGCTSPATSPTAVSRDVKTRRTGAELCAPRDDVARAALDCVAMDAHDAHGEISATRIGDQRTDGDLR